MLRRVHVQNIAGAAAFRQEITLKATPKRQLRGALYRLLSKPIYSGKLRHNDKLHEGQHDGIILLEIAFRDAPSF